MSHLFGVTRPRSILVTGGTGTLGAHVLPLLRHSDARIRVLSRHHHHSDSAFDYVTGDLADGTGLESALTDVDTVLHLAGGPKGDDAATQNLVQAAADARVSKVVYISVIRADRVPLGWFESKYRAERAIVESGLPWTILRAAQFHDLVAKTVSTMAKLGRSFLTARGKRRLTMPVRIPGKAGRAYRSGDNLSTEDVTVGRRTWEAFLQEQSTHSPSPCDSRNR